MSKLAWTLLPALLASCTSDPTRIEVHVSEQGSRVFDNLQLRVGDRVEVTEPITKVEITLPDAMVPDEATVEVWGLELGQQVAFGEATVTPAAHATVKANVELVAIDCGMPCEEGDVECAGDGVSQCEQDGTGCLAWSTVTPCQTDQTCSAGACVTPMGCSPSHCTTPPQATCTDAHTLRTYASGACAGDACSYPHTDQTCPNGCAGGACKLAACSCQDFHDCCQMHVTTQSDQVICDFDLMTCLLNDDPNMTVQDTMYIHENCPSIECL
jgi:hypothetical protein